MVCNCEKITFDGIAAIQIVGSRIIIDEKPISVKWMVFTAGSREKINNMNKEVQLFFEISPEGYEAEGPNSSKSRQLIITIKAVGEINMDKKCEVVCFIQEGEAIALANIFNKRIDDF